MKQNSTKAIALDGAALDILSAQNKVRKNGEDVPQRWHDFIDKQSQKLSGLNSRELTFKDLLTGRASMLAWQPSQQALSASFTPGGLIFLCWGLPPRRGWRDKVMRFLLKRARHILVNDETTQQEIFDAVGREANLVPFFIDMDYFSFNPLNKREDFLFCNGSNDRDPQLLLELAQRGHHIKWLVNDRELREHYLDQHSNLELCCDLTYAELKSLYQRCRLKIMPTNRDVHCAGQTTCMEAISCGTPIVISTGRTASIFKDVSSVSVVYEQSADHWDSAICKILDRDLVKLQNCTQAGRLQQQTKLQTFESEGAIKVYLSN